PGVIIASGHAHVCRLDVGPGDRCARSSDKLVLFHRRRSSGAWAATRPTAGPGRDGPAVRGAGLVARRLRQTDVRLADATERTGAGPRRSGTASAPVPRRPAG